MLKHHLYFLERLGVADTLFALASNATFMTGSWTQGVGIEFWDLQNF